MSTRLVNECIAVVSDETVSPAVSSRWSQSDGAKNDGTKGPIGVRVLKASRD